MVRLLSTFSVLCALLLVASTRPAAARPVPEEMAHVIVQLKGQSVAQNPAFKVRSRATLGRFRLDPTLKPAHWYGQALQRYQDREIKYLHAKGLHLTVGYRMHVVFNGFIATLPQDEVPLLRSAANVALVTPQRRVRPLLDRSLPLIGAAQAWAQLGGQAQAGRGIMIAQIDSGIDVTHPCFRDTGMTPSPIGRRSDTKANLALTNNKVIVARAFGSNPKKTYSAKDDEGHGTFGAAIEACDAGTKTPLGTTISGVAPAAYLMNYNVFPSDDDGTGLYDNLLPALEAAVLDGADVINMSLGFQLGAGDDRLDVDEYAVTNAIRAGSVVVISAGNAGSTAQTVSSPAAAPQAIAVGAATNSRAMYSSVHVGGPDTVPAQLAKILAREATYSFTTPLGPAPGVLVGYGRRPGDDEKDPKADDLAGKDLHGKIAIIERGSPVGGTVTYEAKVNNVAQAGAIGAIIWDNKPANVKPIQPGLGTAKLPTMGITNANGKALVEWEQTHPSTTFTLDPTLVSIEETPDVISDFSARGYGANYSIKPDLVGPGEDIYSATETQNVKSDMYNASGFTIQDGTSFSAPHVTGATALLLQKHLNQAKWTPATAKAVLMETADTNLYLDQDRQTTPTVLEMGAGRLDVGSAIQASAFVSPASLSFGGLNIGGGGARQVTTLTLNDVGVGPGAWDLAVRPLHSAAGISVTVPGSVTLAAGGQTNFQAQLSVSTGVPSGDYDGFLVFTHGTQTLHVPYFLHVADQSVTPGSVLLVDASTSRYAPLAGQDADVHIDVTRYYQSALSAIGKRVTYWDENRLGTPTLADMKQASAVIYFTGNNLNMLQGQNPNGFNPPLGPTDVTTLHDYMNSGGRLFITGKGAAISDPAWTAVVLGAEATSFSLFDNSSNDAKLKGDVSPPQPSATPEYGVSAFAHVGPFSGMKAIDFSTKGDGAKTNLAVYNKSLDELMGVPPLKAVNGKEDFYGNMYGHSALETSLHFGHQSVAVVSSDEPTFSHKATYYPGRAVLFSFGFEGINDNTGYATRAQVMQRIFKWFDEKPTAHVKIKTYQHGVKAALAARYSVGAPAHAAVYTWQIGSTKLKPTSKPTRFTFSRPGSYRVRVLMTDSMGHAALSPWSVVKVR